MRPRSSSPALIWARSPALIVLRYRGISYERPVRLSTIVKVSLGIRGLHGDDGGWHDGARHKRRQDSASFAAKQPGLRRSAASAPVRRHTRSFPRPLCYSRFMTTNDDPVDAARRKAFTLYEGIQTPQRSCGICLAETFGLRSAPYQSLRRGGVTGRGECGAIKAGELVLGEILGDPNPTGPVTDSLRRGLERYRERWRARLAGVVGDDIVCNHLTAPHGDFQGEARRGFCTRLAAEAAAATAEALVDAGAKVEIAPIAPTSPVESDDDPAR